MMSRLKQSLCITAACVMMIMAMVAGSAAEGQTGTVIGGWLILRGEPSFKGTAIARYPSGTVVTITGQYGSWYAVTTPDGRTGYMLGDYLRVRGNSSSETAAWVVSRNRLPVRMRTGPGTGYSVIGSYAYGTECAVLSPGNDWSRIRIGNNTGYMMSQYLTYSKPGDGGDLPVPDNYTVWVTSRNRQGVNLRSGPSQYYAVIGFYGIGTEATMVTLGTTWSYIQVGGQYGYMMTKFLTTTRPSGGTEPVPGNARVVSENGRDVNLRLAPGLDQQVLRTISPGTQLTIITRGDEWYFVRIGDDYGYMMKRFIREE